MNKLIDAIARNFLATLVVVGILGVLMLAVVYRGMSSSPGSARVTGTPVPLPESPTFVGWGAPTAQSQTPGSPAQVQTPTAPPPIPEVLEGDKQLDVEKLLQVKTGMTLAEVEALLGRPGVVISQSGPNAAIYRWADTRDLPILMARFDSGKLMRKNLLNMQRAKNAGKAILTRANYDAVKAGMSTDEVLNTLGVDPKSSIDNNDGTTLLLWSDDGGNSFTGRFRDDKLVSLSEFVPGQASEADSPAPAPTPAPAPRTAAVLRATPKPVPAEAVEQAAAQETAAAPVEEAVPQDASGAPEEAPAAGRAKVTSSGKKDEGARKGSYNPRAKLPAFAHGLRDGSFEVRVNNTSDNEVKAGLRAGNRGVDVHVPAHSQKSVKIDRGDYTFYFINQGDPHTMYGGDQRIDLNGMYATDLQIDLKDDNYSVKVLNAAP